MEISVRAAHRYLVTRFQGEDVRGSDTRHHIHEARALVFRLEGRSGDTYRQHDAVALCRIVSHGVGTDGFFIVTAFQAEQTEFLPCRQILLPDKGLVDVLVVIHGEFRNLNLRIRTGDEVHVLALGQCHDKLFDKRSHVLVGDNLALPLFDAEYGLVDFDAHVALHLHLAAQTPVVLNLLTAEVRYFGRQNLAAALYNLAFALSARALATASRGKEDAVDRQRIQQRRTGSDFQFLFAVDSQFHITGWNQEILGYQQNNHKQQNNHEKYSNAC